MSKQIFIVIIGFFFLCPVLTLGQHVLNSVNFYGETVNKRDYLDNYITVEIGQPVKLEQLENDRINLVNLPKYGHVHLKIDTLLNNKIDATFELYEVNTLSPVIDFGGVRGNIYWQLGLANSSSLGVGLAYNFFYRNTDNRGNYHLNLFKPFAFGKKFGVGGNISKDASVEPVFYNGNELMYKYDKSNASVKGLIYFTPRNVLSLTSSYFVEDYELVSVVSEDQEVPPSDFRHRKFLFSQEFILNKTNFFYYFADGYSISVKLVEVLNLDFDQGFNLIDIRSKFHKRIKERGNLAHRLQIGIATNTDSPFAPFVLDSYLNIRGSGNRQERGTASVVSNLEFRHSLYDKGNLALQCCVFNDSGIWRTPGKTWNLKSISESLRVFSGIGLRFIHKSYAGAIFRIDYGVETMKLNQRGLVLGLGQYF